MINVCSSRINRTTRVLLVPALALLVGAVGGCPLVPVQTTVRLENNGEFPINVDVVFDDEQDIPEDLLDSTGNVQQFTVPAGQVVSFSRDCDSLQAVRIRDADLQIIGSVGPETDSGVERDGSDFGCGDTVIFTFDHSALIVDFNVTARTVSN